jgi:hypothetical protein
MRIGKDAMPPNTHNHGRAPIRWAGGGTKRAPGEAKTWVTRKAVDIGGVDGTRTRDLSRDSLLILSPYNNLGAAGDCQNPAKSLLDETPPGG